MRKLFVAFLLVALMSMPASAEFVNGGFEDGTFSGWTQDGGNWHGSTYNYTGDPGKSAIVTAGYDSYTGGNLSMVYSGTYSARVNNYDNGYHFSTLSQTVADWTDASIYFAWAAVIQNPNHTGPGHVRVTLYDEDDSSYLYDTYIDYYTHPAGVSWNIYGSWGYTDWNIIQLDTSNAVGHDLTLTVLASDCRAGGHGGYAYFDGFGATIPDQDVPEPFTVLLLGLGLFGLAGLRKKMQ